jgi:hypothetical protein
MASNNTITDVLALLHELYPTREIGANTAPAWAMAFAEWDDATLQSCVRQAATTPGRAFFPTPGEIAAFKPTGTPLAFDVEKVLRQIDALGTYSPMAGRIPTYPGAVRLALGDIVADAYATVGGERLFSDDETTRNIARRDFVSRLTEYAKIPDIRPLIASPAEPRKIAPRNAKPEGIAEIVARTQKSLGGA